MSHLRRRIPFDNNETPNDIRKYESLEFNENWERVSSRRRLPTADTPTNRDRSRSRHRVSGSGTTPVDIPHSEATPLLPPQQPATAGAAAGIGSQFAIGSVISGVVLAAGAKLVDTVQEHGLTLPGSEYIGPGNQVPISAAKSPQDQVAKEHDVAYGEKKSTKRKHEEHIAESDETAIKKFKEIDHWSAKVGAAGLTIKKKVEEYTGVLYPQFEGN